MKLLGYGVIFAVFSVCAVGQQQRPPYSPPPYATPPQSEQQPSPVPPQAETPSEIPSNAEVEDQIQKKLVAQPLLAHADVTARVSDDAVVLIGAVENEQQHEIVLRIARSYAGARSVVDKLQIRRKV